MSYGGSTNNWCYSRDCQGSILSAGVISSQPFNSLPKPPSNRHVAVCTQGTVPVKVIPSQVEDILRRFQTEEILLCVRKSTERGYAEECRGWCLFDWSCVVLGYLDRSGSIIDGKPMYQSCEGFKMFVDGERMSRLRRKQFKVRSLLSFFD